MGKNGFIKDLKDASDLGDKIAKGALTARGKKKVTSK
jgi:hypothetical protein